LVIETSSSSLLVRDFCYFQKESPSEFGILTWTAEQWVPILIPAQEPLDSFVWLPLWHPYFGGVKIYSTFCVFIFACWKYFQSTSRAISKVPLQATGFLQNE
jgi:hypothetical protein